MGVSKESNMREVEELKNAFDVSYLTIKRGEYVTLIVDGEQVEVCFPKEGKPKIYTDLSTTPWVEYP